VLKRRMDFALAGLLLTVSFPLLGFCALAAVLDSAGSTGSRPVRSVRGFKRCVLVKPRMADEFQSDRAIEAYEELIDATLMERQT
jgi:lipopolysaccharide/colanic/teichoic acid biosynthesis glycosyltransferase